MLKRTIYLTMFCAFALGTTSSRADWVLDPEGSYLGFASVKNELIAENHSFTALSGNVTDAGDAHLEISLASVETLIPIRNERMQSMLFKTADQPVATVSSNVPLDQLLVLKPGESMTLPIDLSVVLNATPLEKTVLVKVTRSSDVDYDVTSLGPIIIHASQFSLSDGVEALRKIAGLQSISLMVPVTFALRLTRQPDRPAE